MNKPLSEMTLNELWMLFPIFLSEHKTYWDTWYAEEEKRITGAIKVENGRISHIGSTAIRSIWAKPIIDILFELPQTVSMEHMKDLLCDIGYTCMSEEKDRKSFNRGYTSEGFAEKVFHLHLHFWGDNNELYFRDYLTDDPSAAKEYEALKLSLWKKYEHDRNAYTEAKSSFIEKYTKLAKEKYKDRYS